MGAAVGDAGLDHPWRTASRMRNDPSNLFS